MRKSLAPLLAASCLVATAAQGATTAIPPILTGEPSAAAINARCNWFVAHSASMRKALEQSKARPSVATTLTAYDQINELLNDGNGEAGFYRQVSPAPASREAGQNCEVRMASEQTKLSLSRPIYDHLKAIPAPADAATKLYLTRILGAFERAGIALDPAGRAKAQALSDEASKLGTTFEANIPKGQKTIAATVAELDGVPQDFIASKKRNADGTITLKTDSTDYVPVMSYAKSSALRERFYRAYNLRAYPENDAVLRDMINKRGELAQLVGRPNYATLNFEDRMLNTPDKVQALLDDMASAAKPAAERDYAKKLAMLQTLQPGATKLNPWDSSYVSNLVQKRSYGYDRQEARKYFTYSRVRDGILKLTEDLFGVDIRPWNTPKWDPLAESYAFYDHGKLIGRIYFDAHPRDGKYEHANAIPLRYGVGSKIPVGALVFNVPNGLMEHSDVVTFLHEYGHLLHHMFGGQNQRWAGQSSFSTEWDFVEAPSQMLENWMFDYDTLRGFGVDAAGNPIPRDLVEKMNKARYFDLGMGDMRQLGLSNIALQYYLRPAPANLGEAARAYDAKYDLLPPAPGTQSQDSFPHLAGYGAAYYTYRWSVVIADDLFTEFQKNGLHDRATAERYRRLVLQPGGSKPAAELVSSFLGRPISLDAYKAKLAKDQ